MERKLIMHVTSRLSISLIGAIWIFTSLTAEAQSDTVAHRYSETRSMNKLAITRLSLRDVVSNRRSIPKRIRGYKNLEYLSLRPLAVRFAKPRSGPCIIGYARSKTTKFPSWISDLDKLQELDLIGINKIDYTAAVKSLKELKRLKTLFIDPDQVDDGLVSVLSELKVLSSIKIRATLTDEQLAVLKTALPDCKITTGVYADY